MTSFVVSLKNILHVSFAPWALIQNMHKRFKTSKIHNFFLFLLPSVCDISTFFISACFKFGNFVLKAGKLKECRCFFFVFTFGGKKKAVFRLVIVPLPEIFLVAPVIETIVYRHGQSFSLCNVLQWFSCTEYVATGFSYFSEK